MMMIACITIKSGLVPLIEGLCGQILYFRFEIIGGTEWLANRMTLRIKKGARIEIASFSEWLANRKRCAQRKGARIEIASFSEWLANRNRELFRMARERKNTEMKKN